MWSGHAQKECRSRLHFKKKKSNSNTLMKHTDPQYHRAEISNLQMLKIELHFLK